MAYCTNCGKQLSEGAKFCTGCGKPVSAPAFQKTGNNTGKAHEQSGGYRNRNYNIGSTDYRRLNNVCLITKPSQHTSLFVTNFVDLIALLYILIALFPIILPVLLEVDGVTEVELALTDYPGVIVMLLVTLISTGIQLKILLDILHKLPVGFDHWKIRRILMWQVFGPESYKVAAQRLLQKKDVSYPELGAGTDDAGNYYAFTVQGNDAGMYPIYTGTGRYPHQ